MQRSPVERGIVVAPITSYLPGTLPDVVKHLATTEIRDLDLYIGDGLLSGFRPDAISDGMPLRSWIAANLDVSEFADYITRTLTSDHGSFRVVGLTTYLPEIACSAEKPYENSMEAARKMIRLAKALKESGHPCEYVELVCGRLRYVREMTLVTEAETVSLDALCSALEKLAAECRGTDILLAVEAEPGPACLSGHADRFKRMVKEIRSLQSDKKLPIGLNIDMAHMRCMRIDVGDIPPGLVVHAHVNNGPGFHTADLEITQDAVTKDWWKKWFGFIIDELSSQQGCSRSVSIELEAAPVPFAMVRSCRVVAAEIASRLGGAQTLPTAGP